MKYGFVAAFFATLAVVSNSSLSAANTEFRIQVEFAQPSGLSSADTTTVTSSLKFSRDDDAAERRSTQCIQRMRRSSQMPHNASKARMR